MEISTAPALTDLRKLAPAMTNLGLLSLRSLSLPLRALSPRERSTGLKEIEDFLGFLSLAIIRIEPVIEYLPHMPMNDHACLPLGLSTCGRGKSYNKLV